MTTIPRPIRYHLAGTNDAGLHLKNKVPKDSISLPINSFLRPAMRRTLNNVVGRQYAVNTSAPFVWAASFDQGLQRC